jgi:Zn-dependent M16 (insulinase) family peptidase
VVIVSKPSASLQEKLQSTEKARLAAQCDNLGVEGLEAAQKELDDAKAEHDRPIPKELLTSHALPDASKISWIPVESLTTGPAGAADDHILKAETMSSSGTTDLEKYLAQDPADLPFSVQFDHVHVSRWCMELVWVVPA